MIIAASDAFLKKREQVIFKMRVNTKGLQISSQFQKLMIKKGRTTDERITRILRYQITFRATLAQKTCCYEKAQFTIKRFLTEIKDIAQLRIRMNQVFIRIRNIQLRWKAFMTT